MHEQDSVWKELLDNYFEPFLAFFFPQIHGDVDWSKDHESLDKELEKVVRDSTVGRMSGNSATASSN